MQRLYFAKKGPCSQVYGFSFPYLTHMCWIITTTLYNSYLLNTYYSSMVNTVIDCGLKSHSSWSIQFKREEGKYPKSSQMVITVVKLKDAYSLEGNI